MRSFIASKSFDDYDKSYILTYMYLYLQFSSPPFTDSTSDKEAQTIKTERTRAEKIVGGKLVRFFKAKQEGIPAGMAMIFLLELVKRLLVCAQNPELPTNHSDSYLLAPLQLYISNYTAEELAGGL